MRNTVMDSTSVPNVTVIRLEQDYGSAQFLTLTRLEAKLHSALDLSPGALLLDLNDTMYIGAGFVSVLIRCRRRSAGIECILALCTLNAFATEVLSRTRLNAIWMTYASRQVALQHLMQTTAKEPLMNHL